MAPPEAVRRNVVQLHGSAGVAWLARISELAETCAANWSLSLGTPYPGASCSYVLRVSQADGTPAALKLSFPSEGTHREAEALRLFPRGASVALLAYDASAGAMLLERAEPGAPLAHLCETDDEQATSIAAAVVRRLTRKAPVGSTFPSVEVWQSDLRRIATTVELPMQLRALASAATSLLAELVASPASTLLLHGDLHHFNILAAGNDWLAIDPKGVIAERECEIGPLVLNPLVFLRSPSLSQRVTRRIDQLSAEIGLDRRRAHAWAFVRAVLAILWSLADHAEAPAEWIAVAELLRRTAG